VIEAQGLEKRYGEFIAVDNISFSVKEGEVIRIFRSKWCREDDRHENDPVRITKTRGKLEVFGMDVNTDQREIKKLLGVVSPGEQS